MNDFESELQLEFLQEAKELIATTEQSFLQLEKDPSNKDLVDAISRFAHNLKGTSRAVGLGQIAELTHIAENLLLEIKIDEIPVTDQVVNVLLKFNDKVREMIEGLSENLSAQFDYEAILNEIASIIMHKGMSPEMQNRDVIPVDLQIETIPSADLFSEAEAEVQSPPLAFHPVVVETPASEREETNRKQPSKKESKKEDETIRVSLSRMEKLNDLVGELVILQTLVDSSLIKIHEHKLSRSLGKLCKDIQDLSMSLRMVPVGPTFQKLTRVVRDTSKALGKKIDLRIIGEDTEIDKTVVESLGDPLVHIIRNAIDHGVESPEDRIRAGKPEEGVVEVMAFHEGNFLIIQITDDGKGINPQKLIEKAKAKGILAPDAKISDQQAIELIFHPGFSTKDAVSEVSGRGVGMDVVKTNIEELGGEVKIRSKVGEGSCFRLMLPLTLAIIEGMLIETGDQCFVIPKNQVQEINKIEADSVTQMTGRAPYLSIRNEVIPLYYLGQDLGMAQARKSDIAVIVMHGEHAFAVGINDIIKQQQVVVKPPTKEIYGRAGVMGTTILGNGKPALIIDLLSLYGNRVKKDLTNNKKAA